MGVVVVVCTLLAEVLEGLRCSCAGELADATSCKQQVVSLELLVQLLVCALANRHVNGLGGVHSLVQSVLCLVGVGVSQDATSGNDVRSLLAVALDLVCVDTQDGSRDGVKSQLCHNGFTLLSEISPQRRPYEQRHRHSRKRCGCPR